MRLLAAAPGAAAWSSLVDEGAAVAELCFVVWWSRRRVEQCVGGASLSAEGSLLHHDLAGRNDGKQRSILVAAAVSCPWRSEPAPHAMRKLNKGTANAPWSENILLFCLSDVAKLIHICKLPITFDIFHNWYYYNYCYHSSNEKSRTSTHGYSWIHLGELSTRNKLLTILRKLVDY